MLLTQTVEVKIRKNNLQYYLDKGYEAEQGKIIEIATLDLQKYSDIKVKYQCDYEGCNAIHELRFEDYNRKHQYEFSRDKDYCSKHGKAAKAEWMKIHKPNEYKEYYKKNLEKMRKTCLEKYGSENAMQNHEIVENLKKSMLEKYGCENPMQVLEFRQKMVESMANNHSELETIITDNGNICYSKNGVPCSINQFHLSELYSGELNVPVSGFYIDILLENNIYFEYNEQGHELAISLGRITRDDFEKKERRRYYALKKLGYKQIVFNSIHHKVLPSDEVMNSIKEYAISYLSNPDNNWIEFNFDNYNIRTKQGIIDYDYKQLLN